MSSREPQKRGPATSGPATSSDRSLRSIPGFTLAAIAFVMIVTIGIGGAAVANWNQSAKVTIGITAGAAPTTPPPPISSATPTPSPTPTPSATPKPSPTPAPTPQPTVPIAGTPNIVVKPVIASRPANLDPNTITCNAPQNSGNYTISWTGVASATSYTVTLSASDKNYGASQSTTSLKNTANFTLENKPVAYGHYIVRIIPINGTVAGDPVYRTLQHEKETQQCFYADPNGRSPLGVFAVNASPANADKTNNVLNLSWTAAAQATSYKVSLKAKNSSYGAEFTVTSLGTTLIFPPKVLDQWNNPVKNADYFGQYDLRIQPMNETQAGDPVVKVVQYQAYDMTIW